MIDESNAISLGALPTGRKATISNVDWACLDDATARRLQEFGIDEGIAIQLIHHGPVGRDPLALKVGRMTIALRRAQATAITVVPTLP
jgi:ferrous iron transport protein A